MPLDAAFSFAKGAYIGLAFSVSGILVANQVLPEHVSAEPTPVRPVPLLHVEAPVPEGTGAGECLPLNIATGERLPVHIQPERPQVQNSTLELRTITGECPFELQGTAY